jgi:CubicO group peptidase (beta-lactamase class C family)
MPLPPLPPQDPEVAWPTEDWPAREPGPDVDARRLEAALGRAFEQPAPEPIGATHALLVVHRGELVAERYDDDAGPDTTLPSWSMAKSVLFTLMGILVRDGRLRIDAAADVPAWQRPGDPRAAITLDQLLRMSSGLQFDEEYTDPDSSSTIQMLFGAGKADVAGFAADFPLLHPPDTVWSYSSGTSNLLSEIIGRRIGGGEQGMHSFMRRELLDRIGMRTAKPLFDASGTWIGSSFLFATARDFARFGLLCLRDGSWEGERLLPEGWIDYGRSPTPKSQGEYGAHFWLATDGTGTFSANGYRGQYTVIVPERDLVIVRLGTSMPEQKRGTLLLLSELVQCFPTLALGSASNT